MLLIEPKRSGENNADYAYRMIKKNLITMRLQPGTMIGEQEIGEQLKMSRTPVREALVRLARVGIVETIPQVGTRVAMIDYRVIEEVRSVRLLLEQALIPEVCAGLNDENIEKLKTNIAMQQLFLARENQEELMRLDDEFHRMFFEISGRMLTYELLEGMEIHFDRVRYISLEKVRDNKTVQDHEDILEAVIARDAERAKELLAAHLNRFRADRQSISIEYGKYIIG